MDGLANILEAIGQDPLTRWLLLAMALRTGWSLVCWRRCPSNRMRLTNEALEQIEARRQALWRHSARFLVVMLAGISLAVAGLYKLSQAGDGSPVALIMLVGGMYLFMTEPVRQSIADSEDRVHATGLRGDAQAHQAALAMLRGSHTYLVAIEVLATVALGLAVLALSGAIGGGAPLY